MKLLGNKNFPRWIILIYLLIAPLGCIFEAQAQVRSEEDFNNIKRLWRVGYYEDALPLLLDYRTTDRSALVDYMIGTSYCRISRKREGLNYLYWALQHYELTQEKQDIINYEIQQCSLITVIVPSRTFPEGPAGTSGPGKGGVPVPFPVPIETQSFEDREISREELISRLFLPSQRGEAIESVKARLDSLYKVTSTPSFVLASPNHTDSDLRIIGNRLEQILNFLTTEYRLKKPQHFITVYLTPNFSLMSDLGKKLHGISTSNSQIGYSFDEDFSMVAIA